MAYRHERTKDVLQELQDNGNSIAIYSDIVHGAEYLQAYLRGDIKPNDIEVMFCMDGAQLFRDKASDCWLYLYVIMDMAPEIQYKKIYVLPGGCIPGPNNPAHMDSFLFPGFNHIATIQTEGLKIWNAAQKSSYVSHVYFYLSELSVFLSAAIITCIPRQCRWSRKCPPQRLGRASWSIPMSSVLWDQRAE
jgi:hypothetical protein